MASAGSGSQSHLSGAYFQQAANFQSLHVPYRRRPIGRLGHRERVAVDPDARTGRHDACQQRPVEGGRHSLPKRSPLLGDLPSIAETIKGFDYSGWQGFFMPKNCAES